MNARGLAAGHPLALSRALPAGRAYTMAAVALFWTLTMCTLQLGDGWLSRVVIDGAIMSAAMMVPLAEPTSRVVAERTLPRRRRVAVGLSTAGFAVVWAAYGAAAGSLSLIVPTYSGISIVALLGLAIAWQLSPARRHGLQRGRRVKIAAPTGLRAVTGTFGGGAQQAAFCVRSCWAAMLCVALSPHPALTIAIAGALYAEWIPGKNPFSDRRRLRPLIGYAAILPLVLLVT